MDEIKPATEAIAPTIAPEDDTEARFAKLEAEKENYRKAYLKEADRNKNRADENEDEKIDRIVQEKIADSRLAEIAREQDALIQKALKENKELKLAHMNKTTTPPAAMGTHSESAPVRDTSISPDQMAQFKAWGWDDKKIARYKLNLSRNQR